MAEQIIVGIIGAGRIGRMHIEHIDAFFPDVKIKTLVDPRIEEIKSWAHHHNIANLSIDPDLIFNDVEINAVLIFSPTDTHLEYITQAARAHKHIFCEKPIGSDISRIRETLALVEREHVKLMLGFNRRFDHNFLRIREAVQNGDIGHPHIIKITSRDPAPPPIEFIKHSGGLFFDMTIHDWDMARFLADDQVTEVYATGSALIDPSLAPLDIDTAVATLTFKNGTIALIDNSRKAVYGYDQRVEVFGSSGMVKTANDTPNNVTFYTSEAIQADKVHYFFIERYKQSYIAELQSFFECLRNDSSPIVDGRDGLNAVRIAKAALLSLKEHRPVKLLEVD